MQAPFGRMKDVPHWSPTTDAPKNYCQWLDKESASSGKGCKRQAIHLSNFDIALTSASALS